MRARRASGRARVAQSIGLVAVLAAAAPAPSPAAVGAGGPTLAPPTEAERDPLAAELAAAGPGRLEELQARLASAGKERIGRLAAGGARTDAEVARLTETLLVDARRFRDDPAFRSRVVPAIAGALPPDAPAVLRDRLLVELSRRADLLDLAPVELVWGAAERGLLDRLVGATHGRPPAPGDSVRWPEMRLGPAEAPIGVSIYSLASRFFDATEAAEFLGAVRRSAPQRTLVVLADHPQASALAETATRLGVQLVPTWGRTYSPWPRDPLSFLVRPDGSQVAILRPNRQLGREADADMGLELVQDLPAELDARFGPLTWTVAPVPFHNGNLIDAGDALWLSIHTLEPRILELLEVDRVPVESFARTSGVERYVEVARMAAGEIERLFGKPARFVHPLPVEGSAGELAAAMRRLGGGAGFDLDSLVTLLPSATGGPAALVGDLGDGSELIAASPDAGLEPLSAAYGLARGPGAADALRSAIDRSHRRPRAVGLTDFLELVAAHLAAEGFAVHRLPLVLVPTTLLERSGDYPDEDFLLGWNNVVLETAADGPRAEGFAVRLERGDARARALYAELGYRLELLPPLVESVLRNGGYRCASNHLRETDRAGDLGHPGRH